METRDTNQIKKDIDQARDQLATTVDLLATRLNPQTVIEQIRKNVTHFLYQPVTLAVVGGIGLGGVALLAHRVRRRRAIARILRS